VYDLSKRIVKELLMKVFLRFMAVFLAVILSAALFAQSDALPERELRLEDCLKYGLSSHPKVKIAESTLEVQKASVMSADGVYDISLSGGLSYSADGKDRPVSGSSSSVSESLSFSKKIFDPKSDLQKKAVREGLTSANHQFDSTMIDLAAQIKSAYFQAQQKRALLKVKIETLESYEKHLKKVESFVEVGTRPPYDITKAQVDVANARVALISARSALKSALANLAQAMGVEGSINIASYDEDVLPEFDVSDRKILLDQAMMRPDIMVKEANLRASVLNLSKAKKSLSPSLSSSAGYSWRGENSPQNRSWSAGVNLSWPILDGRITKAQIQSAEGSMNNAKASLADLRLSVYTQLENSVTDLSDALERFEANKVLVRQARESLELAEARYDTGIGSPLEVSDARVDYSAARGGYIVSYFDSLIAGTSLDKVLGKLPREYVQK
jgi:outer membrane protein